LLLGREWIHGVDVVPSSMHQRIAILREDGLVENIEVDQSYFLVIVNQVTRKTFEKNLANILPCSAVEYGFVDQKNVGSVRLHPTHGFMWEGEMIDPTSLEEGVIPPTGWNVEENYYV